MRQGLIQVSSNLLDPWHRGLHPRNAYMRNICSTKISTKYLWWDSWDGKASTKLPLKFFDKTTPITCHISIYYSVHITKPKVQWPRFISNTREDYSGRIELSPFDLIDLQSWQRIISLLGIIQHWQHPLVTIGLASPWSRVTYSIFYLPFAYLTLGMN